MLTLPVTLPEHFWDGFGGALVGAMVGGSLTGIGGYLAAKKLRKLDLQREEDQVRRDFAGAVVTVLDELRANRAVVNRLLQRENYVEDLSSIGLSADTYLTAERALAARLSQDARVAVANAYAGIRARYELFEPRTYGPVGGATSAPYHPRNQRRLEGLQADIDGAIKVLEKQRQ
jgi:hypothetical protein